MKSYFKKQKKVFIESIKDCLKIKKTFKIAGVDFLGYSLIIFISLVITGYLNYLMSKVLFFGALEKEELIGSIALMDSFLFAYTKFKVLTIFLTILLLLITYFIIAVFKGGIYSSILKKKLYWGHIWKKFLLNIIWFTCWIVILLVTILILRNTVMVYVFWILVLLIFHLTPILYLKFTQKDKIFNSIKEALKTGFKKIHHFIIPYLVILLYFILISFIGYFVSLASETLSVIIIVLLLFDLVTWSRYYIIRVIKYY